MLPLGRRDDLLAEASAEFHTVANAYGGDIADDIEDGRLGASGICECSKRVTCDAEDAAH